MTDKQVNDADSEAFTAAMHDAYAEVHMSALGEAGYTIKPGGEGK